MKLKRIIVDADFCIKVGASPKYRYLEKVLAELAEKVYIHKIVYDEIIIPACAKEQINTLLEQRIVEIIDERCLNPSEKIIYQGVYQSLANVMINPKSPRKNRGETCSLAMAKTKSIPYSVRGGCSINGQPPIRFQRKFFINHTLLSIDKRYNKTF